MTKEVSLDFNLNTKELECLEIHSIFKNNGSYDYLNGISEKEADSIKVWYNCNYNDSTYDLRPIYFDIIKNSEVVDKISGYSYKELEINSAEEGDMLSFIITPKMLKHE